jgi:hypothetical protein
MPSQIVSPTLRILAHEPIGLPWDVSTRKPAGWPHTIQSSSGAYSCGS